MKTASLHSIETMGLVDGPGIRTVFFLQGCPLKCQYCHNPDTQHFMGSNQLTVDQVLETAERYRTYYEASGGGVTFSGGEPLMQGAFLVEAMKTLKLNGFNTCLDTSGYGVSKYYETILNLTDTILLDVKQFNSEAYMNLTGRDISGLLAFMEAIRKFDFKGQIIIRHVMVPGMTDSEEHMKKLVDLIEPIEKRVAKIEILPYHKSGTEKYSQLGLPYLLELVPEMSSGRAEELEKYANQVFENRYRKGRRAS